MRTCVIFTDLDETLLDRETYSHEPAAAALHAAVRRGIPVVPCTSKTAAETLDVMRRIGLDGPFIVEGGAAVVVPRGGFPDPLEGALDRGPHELIPLAIGREAILKGFARLKEAAAGSIRGFHEMSDAEVVRATGLTLEHARLAREREFDEPFLFARREEEFAPELPRLAHEVGLRVSRGGRFWHLHGECDKGRAVELLAWHFRRKLGPIRTIGIGDSEIDLPMLAVVDVPIAVQNAEGVHDQVLARVPGLRRVPAPGPAGWSLGVLQVLREQESEVAAGA